MEPSTGSALLASGSSLSTARRYRRVLLKVSGEGFAPTGGGAGISLDGAENIATQIDAVAALGIEIAVVVGGGNILRGSKFAGDPRIRSATAHHMGMLGTVINALALQDVLEQRFNRQTRVMTAIEINKFAEPFIHRRALRHLELGRVIILGAGIGNPYFTTDTCAAQRASELGCDVLLKGTKVDGVYTADPNTDPNARKYDRLTYSEFLARNLRVMDSTAIAFCMEHDLPIIVFNLRTPGLVKKVVLGEPIGTLITMTEDGAAKVGATSDAAGAKISGSAPVVVAKP